MAAFEPTDAQKRAIEARDKTVLISAGAGSGKTKVLTERLMSFVAPEAKNGEAYTGGADIDSFIVITYTNPAAGELRGRIMAELSKAAGEHPDSRHLQRQTALCRRAHIGTIHHLCAMIIRENGHISGISPDFKILSDERADAMKAAALEKVLESAYGSMDKQEDFEDLVNTVGIGRDDSALAETVLRLYDKMQSQPYPRLWAERILSDMETPFTDAAQTLWGQEIISEASHAVAAWEKKINALLGEMHSDEKIFEKYSPAIEELSGWLGGFRQALGEGWEAARDYRPLELQRFGIVRGEYDAELKDLVKNTRDSCKKQMQKIHQDQFSLSSADLAKEIRLSLPAMRALTELAMALDSEFADAKRAAGVLDYSDLEHQAVKLLINEDGTATYLAGEISRRYTEVMVDEFQDVSTVQETLFKAISDGGRKLFMVGDVKQSIYGFRLANPKLFTKWYNFCADAANPDSELVLMQENFRSRKEIVNCVNRFFRLCMSQRLGIVNYDEDAELKYSAAGYTGDVPEPELILCRMPEGEKKKREYEAETVAARIAQLLEGKYQISDKKGGTRDVRPGDIAILLRTANAVGGIYRAALERRGIPVTAGQSGEFFEREEVVFMLSMLKAMDNPHGDISLIAALRSPMFGFSADELSEVRAGKDGGDYYSALLAAAENGGRAKAFTDKFDALRSAAAGLPADRLIWKICDETDLLASCSAMADGEQRMANLMQLVNLASAAENDGYRGVHSLVRYFEQLAAKKNTAQANLGSESCVRIMSVHKSKGLQFPIVFLSDTAHQFNDRDQKDTVLVHPELGLGPKAVDRQLKVTYCTMARNAIKLRLRRESLSEEIRLLYVAMTRAEERLFITGVCADADDIREKAKAAVALEKGGLSAQTLSECSCYLAWMLRAQAAAAEKPFNVTVSASLPEVQAAENRAPAASAEAEERIYRQLEAKLSYVYPHSAAAHLPSKVTATELKDFTAPEDTDAASVLPKAKSSFTMPDFAKAGRAPSGTERGIATHLALQHIDISALHSMEDVTREISRLREMKFISQRQAQCVNPQAIYELFTSPLGGKIRRAEKIHREFRFSVLCASEDLWLTAGEETLLQGVVDCAIEEQGQLVIIDYKTDYVQTPEELAAKAQHYSGQVKAYALALGRIFDMPVKETVLYFLSCGKSVSIKV